MSREQAFSYSWRMTILKSRVKCDEGFFFFFPVLANSSSQVRKYDGGSIRRLSVSARWVCPRRSAWPDGEQTPLFAWHATLAITFHKIEIVSYQNSWLTSGREAVPLPRCDVENKTCGQQIHVRQISCLMASIYKPPPTPLSPPYNLFFFFKQMLTKYMGLHL